MAHDDQVRQAWNEVGERFSTLGSLMKERYRAGDQSDDASRSEHDGLREAMDRLAAAARDVADRAGDVTRDDDVRQQARHAAGQLNDALSATVDLIGNTVGGWFGRGAAEATTPDAPPTAPGPTGSAPQVPSTEPVSDDARQ